LTHDRSSSSGEPLDLAILDEELGEVLRVSNPNPMSPFYKMLNSKPSSDLRNKEARIRGVMGDGRERIHTQSISFTGGVEFSFKYFQIGWVSDPFTSP
jgi:hypothetical protein